MQDNEVSILHYVMFGRHISGMCAVLRDWYGKYTLSLY